MDRLRSVPIAAWYIGGAMIGALAMLPIFAGPFSPLPIHTLFLLFLTWGWSVLVVPALFVTQFWLLHDKRIYLEMQIWFLGLLWILTPLYFWGALDLGYHWMGGRHVLIVVSIHVTGLILLSLLAWAAYAKRPSPLDKLLNILSFFYFFWAAFPSLGELP
jgi:hypothetical protein